MATKGFGKGTQEEALRARKAGRKYFYLKDAGVDKLYKHIHANRGTDTLVAFCYTDNEHVTLPWSYVKAKRKPTYTIVQVAAMLNRSRMYINHLYLFGYLKAPQKTYSPEKGPGTHGWYRLSEKDVYDLHSFFMTKGWLNKKFSKLVDQEIKTGSYGVNGPLPSRRELTSLMKYETLTYVRTADGKFVPVWNAPTEEDFL